MPNPPGAEKPLGGMGGGGMAAPAVGGWPAAGGCLNGTWTEATFASGSLRACSHCVATTQCGVHCCLFSR